MTDDIATEIHESISEVNANQWNNVVNQSEYSTVFHRYEWLNSLEKGTELIPKHVVISKKANPIALFPNFIDSIDLPSGVLPSKIQEMLPANRLISTMPGYGGPLVTSNYQENMDNMFTTLTAALDSNVVYHTMKMNDLEYVKFGRFLANHGYSANLMSCRIVLNLNNSWEELMEGMHKSRRRALRRAHEQDAQVEQIDPNIESIQETYDAYKQNMERVGATVLPLSFFEELVTNMSERIRISKAIVDGREVGRLLHLLDNEQSTIHYYFSAIADEDDFEYYPSELLHEHAIRWGQRNGYTMYDFGETAADFTDSLFHYKEQYGGDIVPTLQWQKGLAPIRWGSYLLGRYLYRRNMFQRLLELR